VDKHHVLDESTDMFNQQVVYCGNTVWLPGYVHLYLISNQTNKL